MIMWLRPHYSGCVVYGLGAMVVYYYYTCIFIMRKGKKMCFLLCKESFLLLHSPCLPQNITCVEDTKPLKNVYICRPPSNLFWLREHVNGLTAIPIIPCTGM